MSTKLTLENCYGTYSVEIPKDDMSLDEIIDNIVRSVFLSAGYAEKTVEKYLDGVDE